MVFIGILVSFIIFSLIVLIHEYGHYKTAKFFGIHIEEFGLGIPPRAKKLWKNREGTLFSLNWIPLGGFVKIAGESELHLQYYDKKQKKISLKEINHLLKEHEDIYDLRGNKISQAEKKLLKEHLKNKNSGKNFYEKNIWQKSAVLVAGVVMNFILAVGIFSLLFWIGVKPIGLNTFIPEEDYSLLIPTFESSLESGIILENPGTVLFPIEGSIAEKYGIKSEDILLAINGISFSQIEELQTYIGTQKNSDINLLIARKIPCLSQNNISCDKSEKIRITLKTNADGKIGTYLAPNYSFNEDFIYKYSFIDAIQKGFGETYSQIRLTLGGLKILGKNIIFPEEPKEREEALEKVAGPIGVVGLITDSLANGVVFLCIIAAIISVNLGVFNLLPIPALDGGRLLLLWIRSLIDTLVGKNTLSEKIENTTHIIFFLLLIALSVLIAYNDIIKLLSE